VRFFPETHFFSFLHLKGIGSKLRSKQAKEDKQRKMVRTLFEQKIEKMNFQIGSDDLFTKAMTVLKNLHR
jgi:hypothetical protein